VRLAHRRRRSMLNSRLHYAPSRTPGDRYQLRPSQKQQSHLPTCRICADKLAQSDGRLRSASKEPLWIPVQGSRRHWNPSSPASPSPQRRTTFSERWIARRRRPSHACPVRHRTDSRKHCAQHVLEWTESSIQHTLDDPARNSHIRPFASTSFGNATHDCHESDAVRPVGQRKNHGIRYLGYLGRHGVDGRRFDVSTSAPPPAPSGSPLDRQKTLIRPTSSKREASCHHYLLSRNTRRRARAARRTQPRR
jgi:hypothetical protein